MDALKSQFAAIRAVRDCEGVRALLLDCYAHALGHGEAAGVDMARTLLSGVRAYQKAEDGHAARVAGMCLTAACPAGAVLGAAPFPTGGEWWGLLASGHVVAADDRRAKDAAYWCVDGSGWWRVARREAKAA